MRLRVLLLPLLLILELGMLIALWVIALVNPRMAAKAIVVLEPMFPDPCWYRGGPFLERSTKGGT